jgi:hypothetical protein
VVEVEEASGEIRVLALRAESTAAKLTGAVTSLVALSCGVSSPLFEGIP